MQHRHDQRYVDRWHGNVKPERFRHGRQLQGGIRVMKYENASDNPGTATRKVSFKVNDGVMDSNLVTRNIAIVALDRVTLLDNSGPMTLNAINAGDNGNPGTLVADLLASTEATGSRVPDARAGKGLRSPPSTTSTAVGSTRWTTAAPGLILGSPLGDRRSVAGGGWTTRLPAAS